MTEMQKISPNYDDRGDAPVDMLVLHYTGMQTGKEALERLCDAQAKVSAHYLVEENGQIFALVDESQRAWHAGVASWRGQTDVNARSIGVEIVNAGHEWGLRAFPVAQMQAVIALSRSILSRHPIPARNVVGHSDVAPTRKEDPGELFDWARLAREGVGLWPDAELADVSVRDEYVQQLQLFGYEMQRPEKSILAFQRHFRPKSLTGQWDAECQAMLDWLLAQV